MLTEKELDAWRLKIRVETLETLIVSMAHLQVQFVPGLAEALTARFGQLRTMIEHSAVPGIPAEYSDLLMSEKLDVLDSILSRLPRAG